MNWDNPQPSQLVYILALYEAIKQRFLAIGINFNPLEQPTENCACCSNEIEKIIKLIKALIDSGCFVDGDFEDYKLYADNNHWFAYTDIPKPIDNYNFKDNLYSPFIIDACKLNENMKQTLKMLKEIICKLRYTKIRYGCAVKRDYTVNQVHDPHSVAEAIHQAIAKFDDDKMFSDDSLLNAFIHPQGLKNNHLHTTQIVLGNSTTHYNDQPGYCGYVSCYYAEFETLFHPNFAPDLYCLCGSAKLPIGKLTENTFLDYPIWRYMKVLDYSDYWSGSLGFSEGFNKIRIGHCGHNNVLSFGNIREFAGIPKTPISNFGGEETQRHGAFIGSLNFIAYIYDWAVEGGFKFK